MPWEQNARAFWRNGCNTMNKGGHEKWTNERKERSDMERQAEKKGMKK